MSRSSFLLWARRHLPVTVWPVAFDGTIPVAQTLPARYQPPPAHDADRPGEPGAAAISRTADAYEARSASLWRVEDGQACAMQCYEYAPRAPAHVRLLAAKRLWTYTVELQALASHNVQQAAIPGDQAPQAPPTAGNMLYRSGAQALLSRWRRHNAVVAG